VALLNNDAVADPRWLAELVAALLPAPDAGSCASRVLSYFDRRVVDTAGHVVFADGLTRGRGRGEPDGGRFDAPGEVFCASGSACLLRRAMLDDVGVFDESFFAYCEDADLGFRARLRGWRCLYAPRAVAFHRFSASTAAYSPLKAVHVERNRLWLAVKNLPLPLLLASPAFTALRYVWQAWGALAGRGASGRFARERSAGGLVRLLLRAWAEAARGLPRALRERRIIQARRRASALDVWRWLRRFGIGARAMAFMD
jgi:GT2 family glycosyltransferase